MVQEIAVNIRNLRVVFRLSSVVFEYVDPFLHQKKVTDPSIY